MTPIVDDRLRKKAITVEDRPHERWIRNATVPLRAFRIFNLPQDLSTYTERTRGELVDRCLSHAWRIKPFTFSSPSPLLLFFVFFSHFFYIYLLRLFVVLSVSI